MPIRWLRVLRVASIPLLLLWTAYVCALYLPHGLPGAGVRLAALVRFPSPLVWKPWWMDLLLAWGLIVAALAVGGWILARLPAELEDGERLLLGTACGLIMLILAAASLALVGLFRPIPLRGITVL